MRKALFFLVVLALAGSAAAQKNELALTIGGHFPIDTTSGLSIGHAFMVEGSYARRIAHVPLLGVYAELPVVGSFNSGLSGAALTLNGSQLVKNYSSLFVTPGLQVKIAPSFPVTPFLAAGAGVAHFRSASLLADNTPTTQQTSNRGAVDLGGGLDFKVLPIVGFRVEVRDIFTTTPKLSALTAVESLLGLPTHQHNVLAGFGLTARF